MQTKQRNEKYHRKKSVNLRVRGRGELRGSGTKWGLHDEPRPSALMARVEKMAPRRTLNRPQTSPHEFLSKINATRSSRPSTTGWGEDMVNVTMRLKHMSF